ncbi:MAG: Mg-chelatase subunit ChlD [Clostridium sp.]|jgi:Mg-chelatase subunit ChlD
MYWKRNSKRLISFVVSFFMIINLSIFVPITVEAATTGEINGYVFKDGNGNGKWEYNSWKEPALNGVTVELYELENNGSTLKNSTLTNSQGYYSFNELELRKYRVKVIAVDGEITKKPNGNNVDLRYSVVEQQTGTKDVELSQSSKTATVVAGIVKGDGQVVATDGEEDTSTIEDDTTDTTSDQFSKLDLNKSVEKNQWGLNEEFTVNYTIQPRDIPQGLVPESLYHKSGADISLVIDKSGSMNYGIGGKSILAATTSYVEDLNGAYIRFYNGSVSYYGSYYSYSKNNKDYIWYSNKYYKLKTNSTGEYIKVKSTNYYVDLQKRYTWKQTTEKSRMEIVIGAANNFVDKFKNYSNVRIGLIDYSDTANVKKSLIGQSEFGGIKSSISAIVPNGATNIGDGLRKAYWQLKDSSSDDDKKKFIVLLTDGEPTNYSYYYNNEDNNYYYIRDNRSSSDYLGGNGYSDSDGNANRYAEIIADIIANDSSVNPFMIAFSESATGNKLKGISEIASNKQAGYYKEATSIEDINEVYEKIAQTILSDLSIYGLQLEETFPTGISIVDKSNGLEIDTTNNSEITGDIGNINYTLDAANHVFKAEPINFWVNLKGTATGDYVLGKNSSGNSTSFVNYKDIDGKDVSPSSSFSPIDINIYNNQTPDMDATLTNNGSNNNYNLLVNLDKPSDIVIKALPDSSVAISNKNNIDYVLDDEDYIYNLENIPATVVQNNISSEVYSLSVEAIDASDEALLTKETVPLTLVTLMKPDINTNNLLIQTDINTRITEMKLNGNVILNDQVTDSNGEYTCSNVTLNDGNNDISVTVVNSYNNTTQTITSIPTIETGMSINVTDSSNQAISSYEHSGGEQSNKILKPAVKLAADAKAKISYSFNDVTVSKYKFVQASDLTTIPQFGYTSMIDINLPPPNTKEAYGDDILNQGYINAKHYVYAGKAGTASERNVSFGTVVSDGVLEQRAIVGKDIYETQGAASSAFMLDVATGNRCYSPDKNAAMKAMKIWGYFSPKRTGSYLLGAYSDDGAYGQIIVNGVTEVFVNDWRIAPPQFRATPAGTIKDKAITTTQEYTGINLEAGKYYPIYMEWYEGQPTQGAFVPQYLYNNDLDHEFSISSDINNGNSSENSINDAIPADELYSSNTKTPGEIASAYFGDVAGISFPEDDGIYYMATKFVTNEGTTQGLYGPFIIDNSKPEIVGLEVTSDNENDDKLAVDGNTLTTTFTASEELSGNPQILINGYVTNANITKVDQNTYEATVDIESNGSIDNIESDGSINSNKNMLTDGPITVEVAHYADLYGNEGVAVQDSTVIYSNLPILTIETSIIRHGMFINGAFSTNKSPYTIVKGFNGSFGVEFTTSIRNANIQMEIDKDVIISNLKLYKTSGEGKPIFISNITTSSKTGTFEITMPDVDEGSTHFILAYKATVNKNAIVGVPLTNYAQVGESTKTPCIIKAGDLPDLH